MFEVEKRSLPINMFKHVMDGGLHCDVGLQVQLRVDHLRHEYRQHPGGQDSHGQPILSITQHDSVHF